MEAADLMLSRAKAPTYQGVNGQGGQPGFSSFVGLPQGFGEGLFLGLRTRGPEDRQRCLGEGALKSSRGSLCLDGKF